MPSSSPTEEPLLATSLGSSSSSSSKQKSPLPYYSPSSPTSPNSPQPTFLTILLCTTRFNPTLHISAFKFRFIVLMALGAGMVLSVFLMGPPPGHPGPGRDDMRKKGEGENSWGRVVVGPHHIGKGKEKVVFGEGRKVERIKGKVTEGLADTFGNSSIKLTPIRPVPAPLPSPAADETKLSDFAFAVKTGKETAASRGSIQLLTFLQHIPNKIIVGDSPGDYLGGNAIIDVYSGLYEHTEKLIKERKVSSTKPTNTTGTRKFARRSLPDQITNVEDTRGWKLDAHKNLPALQILYASYPSAKWYMMIDDDTYVLMNNLIDFLKGRNPNDPHYIGNANVFTGCDNVNEFGEGPSFAHGGSGILMSRGAVERLIKGGEPDYKGKGKGIEECILRYKDCWAGDIRTALCMRDHGILVEGNERFSGDPPNKNYDFPENPCSVPLTFHHLLPYQIQTIYESESISSRLRSSHLTTYADVYNRVFPTTAPLEDFDRKGKELEGSGKAVKDWQECENLCKEWTDSGEGRKKCRAWVFDGKKCWLKEDGGEIMESKGMRTGVVVKKYECPANATVTAK
ncbi:hypothetical protein HDU97_005222 [Phlyctochytrium planicorne]|nr:hypothetical protein HDU97_005222 [Phlyctochytrium planicorne]